ncbi:hypothetical protein CEUSTIGMA_g6258.t1 [Chlamydomonas eustigma]|uniref:DUF2415 domain-containing protein n=1 Tax=Chlamydomonas eustigma TaxID=1157962 RepID=A0A250X6W2_9CHLO|nr:hypothetical protein CEUSTIGMA_g6258.t1 [Chlamydomonas eustigma]|eukprot:GAX78821.1 hypothetical protein CEUSTIGMA_g6258.t1 [Chlamydomonas eustigma]
MERTDTYSVNITGVAENQNFYYAKMVKARKQRLHPDLSSSFVTLSPVQLTRCKPNLADAPTPGAVHGNRLASRVLVNSGQSKCEAYIASGNRVHVVSIAINKDAGIESGKEGVLIPSPPIVSDASTFFQSRFPAEIQSLSLHHSSSSPQGYMDASSHLAMIDCYGRAHVMQLPANDVEQDCTSTALSAPAGLGSLEGSWAGIQLSSSSSTSSPALGGTAAGDMTAVTAMRFGKAAAVYRLGELADSSAGVVPLRVFHTLGYPSSLTWTRNLSGSPDSVFALAEDSRVTLFDIRQGERGGLMQQLSPAPTGEPFYSLSWLTLPSTHSFSKPSLADASQGLLVSAGGDRAVVVMEPRKWHTVHKWQAPVKYAIHHLAFSHVNPSYCYVSGMDYECMCGRWDGGESTGGPGSATAVASGNSNSATGAGHGRAVGPKGMPGIGPTSASIAHAAGCEGPTAGSEGPDEKADVVAKAHPAARKPGSLGFSFRSDSRFLGMHCCVDTSRSMGLGASSSELLTSYSQTGHIFALQVKSSLFTGCLAESS